jgi:zinc protease
MASPLPGYLILSLGKLEMIQQTGRRHVLITTALLMTIALLAGLANTAARADSAPPPATMPAADQLLPSDPHNVVGQFANGLHYLIRKNPNPPGHVAIYFAVRTGSLNETAQQNGLAHFLEHMAFKGSTHFAPTKLIPLLTHLGMQFGADANAHTNQYETVFKLTLPNTKPQTLDLGLTIFADYANGLKLYPLQIESERRVILEELRMRRSSTFRLNKLEDNILFPGTPLAIHDVVGDPEIIKTAPQAQFLDYWNQWYRPEKMTLVVVGDISPDDIIARARPLLGTFTARTPPRPATTAGLKPFTAPRALVVSDPEQTSGTVQLFNMRPVRPAITTVGQYRRQLVENISEWIVNRRFSDTINLGTAPFREASASTGDILRDGFVCTVTGDGEPADWKKILSSLILETNRAIQHGFSQHELELASNEILSAAQYAVKTESTRDSSSLVAALTSAIDTDQPILSATQELDLIKQILPTLTAEEVQQAFATNFQSRNYAYILEMPAPKNGEPLPAEQQVLAAAEAAWQQPTAALAAVSSAGTLLASEPSGGHVISSQTDAKLGLTTAVFDNGVIMHHWFSDYRKDTVLVEISLPGGRLQETAENKGVSAVASLMLDRPATSRLSSSQIRDLLSGKNVEVEGGIGPDAMQISVQGSLNDLPLGLQLVHALFTDGKLEQPAVDDWKRGELQALARRPMRADAQLADVVTATLMGNDVRLTPLTPEIVRRQQRWQAQAWFNQIAQHAAIEVAIAGDIQKDDAIALIGRYLGSLPKRTGTFEDLDNLRRVKKGPGPYEGIVHYAAPEPKAMVMAGFTSCDENSPDRRPLSLASLILTDRMIKQIRFDQQLVYSISCQSSPARFIPGTGTITAASTTDPHHADQLADVILQIFKNFADTGPTEDELATAKKQMANQLAVEMKDPAFWIANTAELEYRHRPLSNLEALPEIFQTFTSTQLRDTLRKYVSDSATIKVEVLPNALPSTLAAPATQASAR